MQNPVKLLREEFFAVLELLNYSQTIFNKEQNSLS
jgi:hypothetical protein